jgi:C-terminal processing protease CtpA/Prc
LKWISISRQKSRDRDLSFLPFFVFLSILTAPTQCLAVEGESALQELNQALIHIKESYYGVVDMEALVDSTLQAVLNSLDKDSRLEKGGHPTLNFVRGLEEETSIAETRLISPGIGYIKIGFFGRRTAAHFQKALEGLGVPLESGIKGLLLDLRDNPGGHLQSALEVLKKFVPPGKTLLIEKTRGGEKTHLSEGGAVGARCNVPLPIVILINGSTASSAEVVAAVLRHHCGAKVVGERSRAKGTIQEVIPLGTRTLILTTGEYLLPDGSSLKDSGVLPDAEVNGYDEQLQVALSLFQH